MGSYSRVCWILASLIFISFTVQSVLPLLARSAIGTIVGRVIASRAAAVAANDAVYLTMVNNTSRALAVNAASRSAMIPSQAMLKSGANVITWAGVGYSLGNLNNDELLPDEITIDKNGNYIFKNNKNNNVYKVNELSNKYPYYSYYHEKYYEGINRHMIAQRVFGDVEILEGLICGFPTKPCKLNSIISVSDGNFGNVNIEFDGLVKKELTVGLYSVSVSENYNYSAENQNPEEGENSDEDAGKYISDKLKSLALDIDKLATVINSLWMETASQPGYEGVPFSSSKPVTADEIRAVVPGVNNYTQQEWVKPNQVHENAPVEINVGNSDSSKDPNDDFAETPNPDYPSIDMPTARDILEPFASFFPEYQNLQLSQRNVNCPVWIIPFYGKEYYINSHCSLLEDNRGVFKAIFLVLWAFISLRKLLSA